MLNRASAIKASHRKAIEAALDTINGPFRRAVLAQALYPLTAPRSRDVANSLADKLLRELAGAGRIIRHGHQHWVKVTRSRKLLSGREVPELPETVVLDLTTRCPAKWLAVDLETGDVWAGAASGWSRATTVAHDDAVAVLTRQIDGKD